MYNTKFILTDGQEIYPGYMDEEKRRKLRERFQNEREFMRCGCKPSAGLFYRVSEDLRIYPEHNSYQHDMFCSRYRDEMGGNERKTAYVISDDTGDVVAFTSFDPLSYTQEIETYKEQNNVVPELNNENVEEIIIGKDEESVSKAEKKEPKLTLAGLIRSINVDSFTEKVLNDQKVLSKEKFSGFVYHRMKKVRLARTRKYIGELSLEKDGCRFIYFPFAGFYRKQENGFSRCYLQTRAADGKVYDSLLFPETMEKAVKEFVKAYGMEPDEHTMVAGFQYLQKSKYKKSYRIIGRVHLFQVSDLGIYSRSLTEVKTFNCLQSISETNRDIKFWIPPEDESVGAIVEVIGKPRRIIIYFRNKKDEVVTYDKDLYVPLVADGNTEITEDFLYELLEP